MGWNDHHPGIDPADPDPGATLLARADAIRARQKEGDILDPRHPPIPLRPLQPCVACGEPSRARWCSDACMRAIERRGMLAPAFVVRGWTASSTTTRLRKTNERPRLLRPNLLLYRAEHHRIAELEAERNLVQFERDAQDAYETTSAALEQIAKGNPGSTDAISKYKRAQQIARQALADQEQER